MKTFSILSLTLGAAITIASCNNSTGGSSTPIDATNDTGGAPVRYQAGQPQVTVDTTMHTQPADQRSRQDHSINSGNPADTTTVMPSNTDKKTTSGSSNGK